MSTCECETQEWTDLWHDLYTIALHTKNRTKSKKSSASRKHVLKKKLGLVFFLWEETEGNRFIAEGPSFYETKNLWFFSHLSWLHLPQSWKENCIFSGAKMWWSLKSNLLWKRYIHVSNGWDVHVFGPRTKALKAKTGMKGPLLGKKMVSFRF